LFEIQFLVYWSLILPLWVDAIRFGTHPREYWYPPSRVLVPTLITRLGALLGLGFA
jgi:hypothetical protein